MRFGYDSDINLTTIEDAQGKITTLTYDEDNHIVRVDDPFGRHASFAYDAMGNMVECVDMEGQAFQYTYDRDVRITEIDTGQGSWQFYHEGPDGLRNSNPYPAPGEDMWQNVRLTITNPIGDKEEYYYNGYYGTGTWYVDQNHYRAYQSSTQNNSVASVAKTRWSTGTVIGGKGKITSTIYPDGSSESYGYDSNTGLPTSVRDGNGSIGSISYNTAGQVTSATGSSGVIQQIGYASNGLDVATVVNASTQTTATFQYNSTHQPTHYTDALGRSTAATYTDWGAISSLTDHQGHITTYNYDVQTKRLTSVSRDSVLVSSFAYDAMGRLSSVTDPLTGTTSYEYNDLNKLTKTTYPDGTSSKTDYVCCDMPGVVTDRAGRKSYTDYDPLKRPTRMQDASGNTLELKYDRVGNLIQIIDAKGNITTTTYDSMNRPVRKILADGSYEEFTYSPTGKVIKHRNSLGRIFGYSYNDDGQLAGIDFPTQVDISIEYDSLQRPATITDGIGQHVLTYDAMGRLASVDGPWDNDTLTYSYDTLGRRTILQAGLGANATSEQTTYAYDTLGRLSTLTSPAGHFGFSYIGETGLTHEATSPNNTRAVHGYDTLGRLTLMQNFSGTSTNLAKFAYGFDPPEQSQRGVRLWEDRQYGADPTQRVSFGYDAVNQLIAATSNETTPLINLSYAYDAMGNRSASSNNGNGQLTTTAYAHNKVNQLGAWTITLPDTTTRTGNSTYDDAGNMTETTGSGDPNGSSRVQYSYDELNRLIGVTRYAPGGTTLEHQSVFVYDAFGRKRIEREYDRQNNTWVLETERRFVYDGRQIIQERDGNNALLTTYVGDGFTSGSPLAKRTAQGDFYYHYDGNGNVVAMTDENASVVAQYSYDPYGALLMNSGAQAGANRYRYKGKEQHIQSGLYGFGLRYYIAGSGRWLNRDPIHEVGGLNLYGYVANDPMNLSDPLGLTWMDYAKGFNLSGYSFAEYDRDVTSVMRGYGKTLWSFIRSPYDTAQFVRQHWNDPCAGVVIVNGLKQGFVDFAVKSDRAFNGGDPEAFGEVWGEGLLTAGSLAAPYARAAPVQVGCFVEGTPVLMADGTTKPIELVKQGDLVLSRDESSGKTEAKKVKQTFVRHVDATLVLHFDNGERIETTSEHPFYVEGKGFVKAGELGIGTSIVTRAGPSAKIAQIERKSTPATVYNFHVEEFQTYFVGNGTDALWVHNTCINPPLVTSLLPDELAGVTSVLRDVEAGVRPPLPRRAHWGDPFGNRVGPNNADSLPGTGHTVYDVAPPAGATNRAGRRLVTNAEGEWYYTWNHYVDLVRVR